MAGFNRGFRQASAAIALSLLAHVAQSAEVVSGYWSDVSEIGSVVQASLSPKAFQDPNESRLLRLNLAQLRDALTGEDAINIMLPDPYGGAVEFALRPSSVSLPSLRTHRSRVQHWRWTAHPT